MDYYSLLGVSRDATPQEIKKAYRKMSRKYHPDLCKEENADQKFKEVTEAYEVLSDEQKRAAYDRVGHEAFKNGFNQAGYGGASGFTDFDFSDIFGDIFKGSGFGGFRQNRSNTSGTSPRRGEDLETSIRLTFKEAVFGTTREISINREQECRACNGVGTKDKNDVKVCSTCGGTGQVLSSMGFLNVAQTCPTCHGKGKEITNPCGECHGSGRCSYPERIKVNIPAGVDDGSVIRLSGKGVSGYNGGNPGDVYIVIEVEKDDHFRRDGKNILVNIPLTYTQAVLGTTIECPTIHGPVNLKIPKATQPGAKLRIKGKGVHTKNGDGDQIVEIKLIVPEKLSKAEHELIEQLREVEGDHGHQESFFERLKNIFK